MFKKPLPTDFLPAERRTQIEIKKQSEVFVENKLLVNLIDSLSQMLVILNEERQIIYANKPYIDFCGISNLTSTIGKRPGEALNCIHAQLTPAGCGTTNFCKTCKAAKAILESKQGIQSTQECVITTEKNESIEIEVTATPFEYKGQQLTIFAIIDISDEKRRENLERIFFHDILNNASGISGLSSIMKEIQDPKELLEIANTISQAAENLVDEIQLQQQLSIAERGDLKPEIKKVESLKVLQDLKNLYVNKKLIADKKINIEENAENVELNTDPILLSRVLGNMIKNALEVDTQKSTITLSCSTNNQSVQFCVHNSSYIDSTIQPNLFKRSFSTKGEGRGLGTYSMKLLGENYLNGKVGFTSTKEKGTTFCIEIETNTNLSKSPE